MFRLQRVTFEKSEAGSPKSEAVYNPFSYLRSSD